MRVMTMIQYASGDEQLQPGEHVGLEPYPGHGNTDMTRSVPGYEAWGRRGVKVPKIVLDDGTTIWGPECWWWPVSETEGSEADATVR